MIDWVRAQGSERPHLLGWSSGGRIVERYAETNADRIARLVLLDPAIGGGNRVPFPEKDEWWSNTAAYFRDRLEPEFMEAAAHKALAVQAEAEEALLAADAAFAGVNDMAALASHPHLRRVVVDTPNGPVAIPAPAPIVDGGERSLGAVPALGEST